MTPDETMRCVDELLSHVWMVRTFIKHSEEAEDDEELALVHRKLYDYMHSLGDAWSAGDAEAYLKQARKKLHRLRQATSEFLDIQPEISTHMNFQMARRSLESSVEKVVKLLEE